MDPWRKADILKRKYSAKIRLLDKQPRQDMASCFHQVTKVLRRKANDKKRNELLTFENFLFTYAFWKLHLL